MIHRQVPVFINGPIAIDVDEKIAPLIKALWKHGYRTLSSCQCDPNTGEAWIAFEESAKAQRFASLVGGRVIVTRPQDYAYEGSENDPIPLGTSCVGFMTHAIEVVASHFARNESVLSV